MRERAALVMCIRVTHLGRFGSKALLARWPAGIGEINMIMMHY